MKSQILLICYLFIFEFVQAQPFYFHNLWSAPTGERCRVSSYDKNGGNIDYVFIEPDQQLTIFQYKGSGLIEHIWMTFDSKDSLFLQNIRVNMDFDAENTVNNVPMGMFTGTGPWRVNDINTPLLNIMRSRRFNEEQIGVGTGSFNLNWAMPFSNNARICITNTGTERLKIFYYIDYLSIKHHKKILLFHADYNVVSLTNPSKQKETNGAETNFVFLDKQGYRGKYVGTILCVESHPDRTGKWYEGDDMFIIDKEQWPPRLHGTGTEDYFGMAWGIHREYQAFDHGVIHYKKNITDHDRFFDGRYVLYRFHISDPISFDNSIHASIEAGHANECNQHYESVSFWYGKKNKQIICSNQYPNR